MLTSAEVPFFQSNENRAQHCFENEWTLDHLNKYLFLMFNYIKIDYKSVGF